MDNIGQNIKSIRLAKAINQDVIASDLGMHVSTYGKLERNETKMDIEMLKRIAAYLDEPIEKIFDFKSNYEIKNGDNSPLVIQNSSLVMQNEKILDSHLKLSQSILELVNNQNSILKELTKLLKNNI